MPKTPMKMKIHAAVLEDLPDCFPLTSHHLSLLTTLKNRAKEVGIWEPIPLYRVHEHSEKSTRRLYETNGRTPLSRAHGRPSHDKNDALITTHYQFVRD